MAFHPLPNAIPTDPFTFANNYIALSRPPPIRASARPPRPPVHRQRHGLLPLQRHAQHRRDRGWGLEEADPVARNDQRDNHNAIANYTRVITPRIGERLPLRRVPAVAARSCIPASIRAGRRNSATRRRSRRISSRRSPGRACSASARPAFSGGLRAQQYVQIVDSVNITSGGTTSRPGSICAGRGSASSTA
jgi:hypothetical protein